MDDPRGRQTYLLRGRTSQKVVTCAPSTSILFSYCVSCVPSLASRPIHHVHAPLYWHRIHDSALRDIGHSSLFVEAGQISHTLTHISPAGFRSYDRYVLLRCIMCFLRAHVMYNVYIKYTTPYPHDTDIYILRAKGLLHCLKRVG